jgi:hypothetical protein
VPTRCERAAFLTLDEIIKVVSERLGVSEPVARQAVKVLLEFACKRAAGTKLEKLLMEMPGVTSLLGKRTPADARRSSEVGELVAGSIADLAKAFFDLRAAGLRSSQIRPFLQTFLEKAREITGPETIEEILRRVPALKAFLKSS